MPDESDRNRFLEFEGDPTAERKLSWEDPWFRIPRWIRVIIVVAVLSGIGLGITSLSW